LNEDVKPNSYVVEDYAEDAPFEEAVERSRFWEEDKYLFEVLKVSRSKGGEYGPSNVWEFGVYQFGTLTPAKVNNDTQEPYTFKQYFNPSMAEGSQQRDLIEAIMGRKLATGEQFRVGDVLNKRFAGFIQYEAPRNKPNGEKKPRLKSPSPFRPKAAARRPIV
jgi:hypothetical protein